MIFSVVPRTIFGTKETIPLGFLDQPENLDSGKVIVLGREGVADNVTPTSKKLSSKLSQIDAQSLLVNGEPDFSAIQKLAHDTSTDKILVLDLTSLHLPEAFELLNIMRLVWIHLPAWHRALVVVCEEGNTVVIARHMANVFLITSRHLTNAEVRKKVKSVTRRAALLRLVGNGRLAKLAYNSFKVYAKLKAAVRKYV